MHSPVRGTDSSTVATAPCGSGPQPWTPSPVRAEDKSLGLGGGDLPFQALLCVWGGTCSLLHSSLRTHRAPTAPKVTLTAAVSCLESWAAWSFCCPRDPPLPSTAQPGPPESPEEDTGAPRPCFGATGQLTRTQPTALTVKATRQEGRPLTPQET